jgi:hypothetical protein
MQNSLWLVATVSVSYIPFANLEGLLCTLPFPKNLQGFNLHENLSNYGSLGQTYAHYIQTTLRTNLQGLENT